jgi:hypothetical protein
MPSPIIRPIKTKSTHHSDNPFIKGLGFLTTAEIDGSINHAIHTDHLLLFWKHADIILERVWNPESLGAHIRHALMRKPILRSR